MQQINDGIAAPSHSFVFRGDGGEYFLICLVNVLWCVLTLGIYLPWALMKCRRYIYSNMELNGQRFSWGITGGDIFRSCCAIAVFYLAIMGFIIGKMPVLGAAGVIGVIILLPFMCFSGLRYQAMMTSINGVRFGFSCSFKQFCLQVMGLLFVMLALVVGCLALMEVLFPLDDLSVGLCLFAVAGLILAGVINGVLFSKIMSFLWRHISFGVHRFEAKLNTAHCIKVGIVAIFLYTPFLCVSGYFMVSGIVCTEKMYNAIKLYNDADTLEQFITLQRQMVTSQVIGYLGEAVFLSYLTVSLRNYFMSNLSLGGGAIRFRSTLAYSGMLYRMTALVAISGVTCGLAYPLLKMWMIKWQAQNTHVIGNLDTLSLNNVAEQPEKGFIAKVSRGIAPTAPFL